MTNQKQNKKSPKNAKIMGEITKILQERSIKSFVMTKEVVLNEKRECKELNKAFEYYVKNRIDYIHVGLISLACEAVNGNSDDTIPIQAVMLLITAAIDVHDDIIDGSKTKYGKPTLFSKFGKDIALLVGDAFLIKGLALLHKLKKQFSTEKIDAIFETINALLFEMGDAEAIEATLKRNINVSARKYLQVLRKKASNFEMYMRIGAIVGDGKESEIDSLGHYGRTLGILTGIREDFIDIFEPDELQNRMKNELLPLPILRAFKTSQTKKVILNYLSRPKITNTDTEKIVEIISEDENVRKLKNEIQDLGKQALKNISFIRNSGAKSLLKTLVLGVLEDL